MNRKDELLKALDTVEKSKREIVLPLIDDIVFIEEQLKELKKLPFIKVHPQNPSLQKPTAAAKQYKELLQQYNNCIKVLCSQFHTTGGDNEESPLRMYLRGLND